jgi:hypothetical protein
MAKAEDYAKWIVANADKQGTPDFETVAKAYQEAKSAEGLQAAPAGEGMPAARAQASDTSAGYNPFATAASFFPSLYQNTVGGLVNMVTSPLQSAQALGDVVAGGVYNAMPEPIQRGLTAIEQSKYNPLGNPQALKRASAVGQEFVRPYSSGAEFQKTMEEDPFRVVGDLSMLLGGSGAALRAGTTGAKSATVANALTRGSELTNPINAMIKGGKLAGATVTEGIPAVLGLTTGVGGETVKTALKSGLEGKTAFKENMRGEVPITQVLDDAKTNLAKMNAAKQSDYRSGMVNIANDNTVLNFTGIDNALTDAEKFSKFKGKVINETADNLLTSIKKTVDDWKQSNPADFHTPEGLDKLKQAVWGEIENLPQGSKQAYSAGKKIYDAIKSEISNQAPTYAKVMKDYSEASDLVHEIERALSLGQKASADTAIRKLQSLTRNNVTTNYGQRTALAEQLAAQGGNELMPALSGQAMSSFTPRNLAGQGGAIGAGLGAFSNPTMLAAMPFMSPRLVGEAAYGAGSAARGVGNYLAPVTNALGPTVANAQRLAARVPMTPQQARMAALMAAQAGNTGNQQFNFLSGQ